MSNLKTEVRNDFKLHGFQLRLDALRLLEGLLSPLGSPEEAKQWLKKVIDALAKKNLDSAVITADLIQWAVQECSERENGDNEANSFHIIDAFDVPRFTYSLERKKFLSDGDMGQDEPVVYSEASRKADIFCNRYEMIQQRTMRHHLFTPSSSVSNEKRQKKVKLQTVEFLLGTSSKVEDIVILGMLTQVKHNQYSLEDPTGVVSLHLSESKFHTGIFTETCFVLAEGWYEDELFHVCALGFPPAETAKTSRAYFGSTNFFGGPADFCPKTCSKLALLESQQSDAMFVFLSDVWLDSPYIINKLRELFSGYNAMPPYAIVMMGNFLQNPYGSEQAKVLKDHFGTLADILIDFPELISSTKFIFVPGPADPGFNNIFPRPPLPSYLTQEFRKKITCTHFVSNPCRVQYCTQEIVLFREDIVTKMCRNCIYFPDDGNIANHFVKTLVTQGHLAPLPLHICPTYWDFDRSMYLYPLPDLVVTADKFDPFIESELECKVINPGSFGKNDFMFMTYIPKTKEVEESQIPDDM